MFRLFIKFFILNCCGGSTVPTYCSKAWKEMERKENNKKVEM
jgi:hypothetical protein